MNSCPIDEVPSEFSRTVMRFKFHIHLVNEKIQHLQDLFLLTL